MVICSRQWNINRQASFSAHSEGLSTLTKVASDCPCTRKCMRSIESVLKTSFIYVHSYIYIYTASLSSMFAVFHPSFCVFAWMMFSRSRPSAVSSHQKKIEQTLYEAIASDHQPNIYWNQNSFPLGQWHHSLENFANQKNWPLRKLWKTFRFSNTVIQNISWFRCDLRAISTSHHVSHSGRGQQWVSSRKTD